MAMPRCYGDGWSVALSSALEGLTGEDPCLWDLFTRREEYSPRYLDRHLRFPHSFSSCRNALEPGVSEHLVGRGFMPEYPDGRTFAVCLTHDIDCIHFARPCLLSLMNSMSAAGSRIGMVLKAPFYLVHQRSNPLWNLRDIVSLEERYGAKSSFFFMASERDLGRRTDYAIEALRDDIREILSRGWSVGLHTGYHSYDDLASIRGEKERLERTAGREVLGCRNHFLRFRVPKTWSLLSRAGFRYDTTFGYADFPGFRNGMCHPFTPFDLREGAWIPIIEIPLTVMDCTLFEYLQLDEATAWDLIRSLLQVAEANRGVITVLWHNNYMFGGYLKCYEKILRYCKDRNAWLAACENIYSWWTDGSVES